MTTSPLLGFAKLHWPRGKGIICAVCTGGPDPGGTGDPVGRVLGGLPDSRSWAGRRMLQGYS